MKLVWLSLTLNALSILLSMAPMPPTRYGCQLLVCHLLIPWRPRKNHCASSVPLQFLYLSVLLKAPKPVPKLPSSSSYWPRNSMFQLGLIGLPIDTPAAPAVVGVAVAVGMDVAAEGRDVPAVVVVLVRCEGGLREAGTGRKGKRAASCKSATVEHESHLTLLKLKKSLSRSRRADHSGQSKQTLDRARFDVSSTRNSVYRSPRGSSYIRCQIV